MEQSQADEEQFDDAVKDELERGHTLMQGQFTIDAFLNAGGFGITYLARNSLGRKVVIKECFPEAFCRRTEASVQARSRSHVKELSSIVRKFIEEAHTLARVKHPNIVGVHQVFEENKTAYMVLDFVEGCDLLDIIEGEDTLPEPAQIETILNTLLHAVSAIHEQNMLHRDISPDNILLKPDMEPVLIDFGAARQDAGRENRVLSELRVIKDGYSPQEFYVSGAEQGPSSDLYALAATFYHVITGEIPANSQSRLAAIAVGDGDPYLPVVGRIPAYSERFLIGIDKALAIMPNDRFSSAEQWREFVNGSHQAEDTIAYTKSNKMAANGSAPTSKISKRSRARVLAAIGLAIPIIGSVFVLQKSSDGPTGEQIDVALADTDPSLSAVVIDPTVAVVSAPSEGVPSAADLNAALNLSNTAAVPEINSPEDVPVISADELDAVVSPSQGATADSIATLDPIVVDDLGLTLGLPTVDDELAADGTDVPLETAALEPEHSSLVPDTNGTPLSLIIESYDLPQIVSAWSVDLTGALSVPTETIYEIDGLPLDNDSEIDTVLHQMMQAPEGGFIELSVLVGASKDSAVVELIKVPVIHKTSFSDGTLFETHMVDATWSTVVTNAPDGGEFENDDILVGDLVAGELFDRRTSFPDALVRGNAESLDWLTIGVRRQGIMSPIGIPLQR